MNIKWDKLTIKLEFDYPSEIQEFENLLRYAEGGWKPCHEGDVVAMAQYANSLIAQLFKAQGKKLVK